MWQFGVSERLASIFRCSTLKLEAKASSEVLVHIYQTTWYRTPEEYDLKDPSTRSINYEICDGFIS
jgi:hypothetical protein